MKWPGRPHGAAAGASNAWLCLSLLAIGMFLSAIIPPFQSPDEFDHIKRAYLLTRGQIVLDAPAGDSSGGMLDLGLASYSFIYQALPFRPQRKLSADEVTAASRIKWSGEKGFSPAPGTGYYFPMLYLPQAIGLGTGRLLGWTVERSYYFARFLALSSVIAILFVAFTVRPPSPLTAGLLILPMTLFQFASASLDGVSTAVAVLAASIFLRIGSRGAVTRRWHFPCLVGSVALVTACRFHLLPLWALVFVAALQLKNRKGVVAAAVALLLVLAWLGFTIAATVDTRQAMRASTADVALHYVLHPLKFLEVLATTLTTAELLLFYRDSFVGVLGWLDTRFSDDTYFHLSLCIALLAAFSLSVAGIRQEWIERSTLLLAAACSVLLIFFALLITWSPHPASVIQGVQGRYFLVPALLVSLALTGRTRRYDSAPMQFAWGLVILLAAFTIFSTPRLLIDRYYLAPVQSEATHSTGVQPVP